MHHRIRLTLLATVTTISTCCCVAFSDDSAMSIVNGGTVQPMTKHASIRMVREAVDVKLGARVGNEWPVFVRCQFEFRNDGTSTNANLGFPETAEASGEAAASGRLKGFKSWVDGQPAKIVYMPSAVRKTGEFEEQYKAWYVKKVHFDAGQSRRVVVVYSARLGISNTSISPDGMVFNFGYILRTGANWNGLIEEAIIKADISAAKDHYRIDASPSGYKSSKNKLTWTLKNFEPIQDIAITFTQIFPLFDGKALDNANILEPCFERNGVLMTSPDFLGANCTDHTCIIKYAHHVLRLRSSSKAAVLDGKNIMLLHAPWQDKESDAFAVPLEEIVKLLGGSVEYDSNHRANVHLKLH